MKIQKKQIISQILEHLNADLAALSEAAKAAHEAAIDEESISEDIHDTRSIEAGYLAGAQMKRVAEIKELIAFFKFLEPKKFKSKDKIIATALVTLGTKNQKLNYFLVPKGGGIDVMVDKNKISTLTPQTPLGEALLERKTGDDVAIEVRGELREYEILSVI